QRHLFGGQPKIDRHHHGARPRNCKITGVETIAVERQQRHAIAGAHATCGQAAGKTRNIISNLRPGALAPFKLRGNTVTVDLRRTADQSGERQHDEYLLLALFSFKFMQYSLWRCTPAAPQSSLRAMRLSTAACARCRRHRTTPARSSARWRIHRAGSPTSPQNAPLRYGHTRA